MASANPQPAAILNGEKIPQTDLRIPYWDAGFVMGTTITEQLRTFGGRLFQLEAHLDRLLESANTVGIEAVPPKHELRAWATTMLQHNFALRAHERDELGLGIFVTPGAYATFGLDAGRGPTVGMYTYRLAVERYAEAYESGCELITVDVRQIAPHSWPARIKCRSRMHYHLATREALAKRPGAHALLLNADRTVSETPTANVFAVFAADSIVSPPLPRIFPGISLRTIENLIQQMGGAFIQRDLRPGELLSAREVMLSSTPFCVLPVTSLDGQPIGGGRPGPMFRKLVAAWSELVGIDITAQARGVAAIRFNKGLIGY